MLDSDWRAGRRVDLLATSSYPHHVIPSPPCARSFAWCHPLATAAIRSANIAAHGGIDGLRERRSVSCALFARWLRRAYGRLHVEDVAGGRACYSGSIRGREAIMGLTEWSGFCLAALTETQGSINAGAPTGAHD